MAKETKREQIARAKAARLMEQVQSLGLLLKASVVRRRFRCGKPGCRCVRGYLHQDMIVTRKAGGRTQTIRVRQGRETEALAWLENWRRLKQILSRLTDVEMRILRMPVQAADPGYAIGFAESPARPSFAHRSGLREGGSATAERGARAHARTTVRPARKRPRKTGV